MAFRYLAIFTDDPAQQHRLASQVKAALPLLSVAAEPLLFTSSEPGLCRQWPKGAVLGHLFTRSDAPRPTSGLSSSEIASIEQTSGDYLLAQFWGGYLGIVPGKRIGHWDIVRDPSGALPCYFTTYAGALIVASDVDALFEAGFIGQALNWEAIGRDVLSGGPPTQRTALRDVTELLAGWRLTWSGGRTELRPWWSPWNYVAESAVPVDDLVTRLRTTIMACVGAWGLAFRRPLLGVSGGLDSSIVAASLKAAGTDVCAFTMATNEPFGDERSFAQSLCDHLGIPLFAQVYDLAHIDIERSTSLHLARPGISAFGQSNLATRRALAQSQSTDAFFSGIGGDNVFYLTMSATPLLDCFLKNGLSIGTWRALRDICHLTRCSIWDAIAAATARAREGGPAYPWRLDTRFLNPDLCPGGLSPVEPGSWLSTPKLALPGKAVHIARIIGLQYPNDLFPRSEAGPQIQPLFSQPIVELCLSIPSWLWCTDGQNRSLARRAFAPSLPRELIARKSKGGPDSFAYDVTLANCDQIRELLLDGVLARQGLLDRGAVDSALRDTSRFAKGDHLLFLSLTEAETWARGWLARTRLASPRTA
ncbi:asparagine synthase-related protein [Asticcacaulis sp.]|uniref:asparagine synthase-related protein n=1 Tax=Asticcacaulis sp. TaxID=1872648 RepID=UPI002B73996D|nr:asparagine synthase-related protein [Asticcacaulis sp.]HTM82195.1 asparagine synthase-related protein [Asticcacaulis sp.]